MKKLASLLSIIYLVLVLIVVSLDHYRVNISLNQIESNMAYNNDQLIGIFVAQDNAESINDIVTKSQEVTAIQVIRIAELEAGFKEYKEQNWLLNQSLETTCGQLKDLVDDNSDLEEELDARQSEILGLKDKLQRAQEALEDIKEKLKKEQEQGFYAIIKLLGWE